MKSEDLLNAFTNLDDTVILDAQAWEPKKKINGRRLTAALTAAVLASTLVLTAFAASDGAAWFRNFFSRKFGRELSQSQMEYIGENTAQFRQSHTQNGYTLTLDTAISDGVHTYIRFQLTAPEGVALDAHSYSPSNWMDLELTNARGECYIGSSGWDTIDDDPSDNAVSLLYTCYHSWDEENYDSIFGSTWDLRIEGLKANYIHNYATPEMTFEEAELVSGVWEFDIQFPQSGNRTVELISDPVDCPCEVRTGVVWEESGQGHFTFEEEKVRLTSFQLRALSASVHFSYSEDDFVNADFGDFYAVMNDGSKIRLREDTGAPNQVTFTFDAPIILDEVDHILLPGGTKLPMPQEITP